MKLTLWKINTLALVITLFLFCGTNENSSDQFSADVSNPRYGGQLVIGISSDIDTFNPLFSTSALGGEITHLMLLGLADLNEKGEFVPEIAKSWSRSEDYMAMTYYLREDAVWSDGHPISAYDVAFTYDMLMDTTVGSPRQGFTEFIKKVEVKDSFTVTFHFTEAYPDQMFDTAGEVLPKHLLENADRRELNTHLFGRQPLSSGPFVLKNWESKQYIELVPNEKYFAGRPYLDKVVFKIVPDKTNLFTQLRTGEVDMLLDVSPEKVSQLNNTQNIDVFNVPGRVYNYIGYNEKKPMFKDAAVRRALTMAIDRNEIIDALLYGFGKPCISSFPPMISWAFNDDIQPLPHDPAGAKALLEKAGWKDSDGDGWLDKNGEEFEFSLITNADNSLRGDIAVIVQNQLKKVGIKADIQLLEWTTMLEDMRNKKFDAFIGGLSTSFYVDPTPIYHSSAVNLFNHVGYGNPQVDRLIEKGRVEMDRQKVAKIWHNVQELIYADQPYTYLFWINRVVAVHKRFKNVTPITLSSLYELEKWYEASAI